MPKKEKTKKEEPKVLGSVEQTMGTYQEGTPVKMVTFGDGTTLELSKFNPTRLNPRSTVTIDGKVMIKCPYCLGSKLVYNATCPKCKGVGVCERY